MIDVNEELAQDYLADCRENLAAMETELMAIIMRESVFNDERLNRIFRAAHAVCGPAAYFDLVKIRELAYETEHTVATIRSRNVAPTAEDVRVLLRATDKLQELINNPDISNQADTAEITADLAQLRADRPVLLDLSSDALSSDAKSSGSGHAPAPTHPHPKSLRILLVEDDFACRFLMQSFLARYGECHIAVNGKEAVDVFRAAIELGQSYNLICMDIMMPEMDGREAVRHIRALEQERGILSTFGAKIFMTTTVQQVREVFLCFKELCDAYLMKPIDLGQLVNQMKFYQLIQ